MKRCRPWSITLELESKTFLGWIECLGLRINPTVTEGNRLMDELVVQIKMNLIEALNGNLSKPPESPDSTGLSCTN